VCVFVLTPPPPVLQGRMVAHLVESYANMVLMGVVPAAYSADQVPAAAGSRGWHRCMRLSRSRCPLSPRDHRLFLAPWILRSFRRCPEGSLSSSTTGSPSTLGCFASLNSMPCNVLTLFVAQQAHPVVLSPKTSSVPGMRRLPDESSLATRGDDWCIVGELLARLLPDTSSRLLQM
jgi:hypothetical protein